MRFRTLLSVGVILLLSSVLALAALDLRFTTAITQSPDPAKAGNTVTFTVSFRAFIGGVTNLQIIGGVDGTNVFTQTYPSIAVEQQKTITFNWTATTGSHKAWFVLDPAKTTGDFDYSNNRIEKNFTVGSKAPQVSQGPTIKPVVIINPNLLPKYIKVTDPYIEALWYSNSSYWIKWKTNITGGLTFHVDLYSVDKTTKIRSITQSKSNSFEWLVPMGIPGTYRIRVLTYLGDVEGFVVGFSEIFQILDPE